MNIAILGATSHIAKNLIYYFRTDKQYRLFLFARNVAKVQEFLNITAISAATVSGFEEFSRGNFDAIINCVGFADPAKQKNAGVELFLLTEHFDNIALSYLKNYPDTKYINFSSGAVYGTAMNQPVLTGDMVTFDISPMNPVDFYRISKLQQEAKHRSCPDFNIVDIRLFSFFSRFIDRDAGFLMSEIVRSLDQGLPLKTTSTEVYRDYISPYDLSMLVKNIIEKGFNNGSVDTYSKASIAKSELFESLSRCFELQLIVSDSGSESPTGSKPYYFSESRLAGKIFGFDPVYTSWERILKELLAMGYNELDNT